MIYVVNGGGSGKLVAVIAVTYPAGSVCTCTNGTKTLKTKDTSGKALFNVTAGNWTVTAASGSNTKSQTVTIMEGQSVSVTLSYAPYYYDKGDQCVAVTGGWVKTGAGGSLTFGTTSMVLDADAYLNTTDASTINKVDLTDVKTLYFAVKSTTTYPTGYPRVGVVSKNDPNPNGTGDWIATKTLTAGSEIAQVSLDVSSLNGSYYIVFGGRKGDSGGTTIEVEAIWGDYK